MASYPPMRLVSLLMMGICAGLCNNEIHAAVLNRSEPRLRTALQRSRTSVDESNEVGHTPLHLASNWPCGLSLLLAHGADMESLPFGYKPVQLAITHGCTESVELLLKAGCSFEINPAYFPFLPGNIFAFAIAFLAISVGCFGTLKLQGNCFEIVKIIINNLALRRGNVIPSMIDAQVLIQY